VDTNKDGAISLEEFVQGFVTWKHYIEEQVMQECCSSAT